MTGVDPNWTLGIYGMLMAHSEWDNFAAPTAITATAAFVDVPIMAMSVITTGGPPPGPYFGMLVAGRLRYTGPVLRSFMFYGSLTIMSTGTGGVVRVAYSENGASTQEKGQVTVSPVVGDCVSISISGRATLSTNQYVSIMIRRGGLVDIPCSITATHLNLFGSSF